MAFRQWINADERGNIAPLTPIEPMNEITVAELKLRLDAGDELQLIDVRQPDEFEFARIDGFTLIPLGEVPARRDEIDEGKETVVMCKMGGRSARAIQFLESTGFRGKLYNLVGGITAWSGEIDGSIPRY